MGSDTILENFEDLEAVGEEHRLDVIETTKVEVFELLKETLRPEFLNRIDEQIMFTPLTKEEIKKIAVLLLKKVRKSLHVQEMGIEFSDSAMALLADLGYDPQFGARPLKRVIQREIVNALSKLVLAGSFSPGETIHVGTDSKGFTFTEKATGSNEKPEVEQKSKKEKDAEKLQKAADDVQKAADDLKKKDEEN